MGAIGFETGPIKSTTARLPPLLQPGDEQAAAFEIGPGRGRGRFPLHELPPELVQIDAQPNERGGRERQTDRRQFPAHPPEPGRGQWDQRRGGPLIRRRMLRGQRYQLQGSIPSLLCPLSIPLVLYLYNGALASTRDRISRPTRPAFLYMIEVDRAERAVRPRDRRLPRPHESVSCRPHCRRTLRSRPHPIPSSIRSQGLREGVHPGCQ